MRRRAIPVYAKDAREETDTAVSTSAAAAVGRLERARCFACPPTSSLVRAVVKHVLRVSLPASSRRFRFVVGQRYKNCNTTCSGRPPPTRLSYAADVFRGLTKRAVQVKRRMRTSRWRVHISRTNVGRSARKCPLRPYLSGLNVEKQNRVGTYVPVIIVCIFNEFPTPLVSYRTYIIVIRVHARDITYRCYAKPLRSNTLWTFLNATRVDVLCVR